MPKPRRLSGAEVASILQQFGFQRLSQRGSHLKLRRVVQGSNQTLVVPLHRELDSGTVRALYRQATEYIPSDQLYRHFFSD